MEMTISTTVTIKKTYRWENRLSFEDRVIIEIFYSQGYAVWNIAKAFGVSAGTVEYHLKEKGLYVPNRKVTMRNKPIAVFNRLQPSLVLQEDNSPRSILKRRIEEEDRRTEAMQKSFPKSYKEYLQRAQRREPKVYNGNYFYKSARGLFDTQGLLY